MIKLHMMMVIMMSSNDVNEMMIPGDRGWGGGAPGRHTGCLGRWAGVGSRCCSCTSGARLGRRRSW